MSCSVDKGFIGLISPQNLGEPPDYVEWSTSYTLIIGMSNIRIMASLNYRIFIVYYSYLEINTKHSKTCMLIYVCALYRHFLFFARTINIHTLYSFYQRHETLWSLVKYFLGISTSMSWSVDTVEKQAQQRYVMLIEK